MSTATVATLVLPDWLAGAKPPFAGTEYGKRSLSWTLLPPGGVIYRCQFTYAWFTVTEREPWRGEPLWLWALRRDGDGFDRGSFTARARERMEADLIPAIVRYGFDRLWIESRSGRGSDDRDRSGREADRHQADMLWWREKQELDGMLAAGHLEFKPCPPTPVGQRPLTIRVVPPAGYNAGFKTPMAAALLDGEQVGWLTDDAEIIPMHYRGD